MKTGAKKIPVTLSLHADFVGALRQYCLLRDVTMSEQVEAACQLVWDMETGNESPVTLLDRIGRLEADVTALKEGRPSYGDKGPRARVA